ncbi:Spo0B C-terminal domain-containing protein [Desertibacillus haloalkaliphilus]|uniref:Spo0B C-terminal domain-containing protein n=1 Tax=Desertibacillus haloalkaliphilus TaxID=1328930 RepID=UPI001C2701BE|nr:Spo0B C-terminal domain-containing protein [Desertibacillus haloalkaliphilus]MBU8905479.1 sporulation initiation phosphotransferase B [Desertibacillus haloalkaliphilus]
MSEKWDVLDLLSHTRHDWLNQIQLIKGNLALNRLDRVEEVINDIINQTRHESKLTNIGVPKLARKFLTFNWEDHSFELEFEVLGEVGHLTNAEDGLYEWCLHFFELIDQSCRLSAPNHLLVTLHLLESENNRITFDFHGELSDTTKVTEWLATKALLYERVSIMESYVEQEEVVVTIKL